MEPKEDSERAVIDSQDASENVFSVWWDEPADQDPQNPMAWSSGRRWGIVATISFLSFLTWVHFTRARILIEMANPSIVRWHHR